MMGETNAKRTFADPRRAGTIAGALKAGEVLEFGAFEIRFARGVLRLSYGEEAELQVTLALADRVAIHGTTRGAIIPIIREDVAHGSGRRDARTRPAGNGGPPAASPEPPFLRIGPGGSHVRDIHAAELCPAAHEEPGDASDTAASG